MSKIATFFTRVIPGAFIANSGAGKIGMPAEASAGLQQYAATGVPLVKALPADKFGTILGVSEVALGAALAIPAIPNRVAGVGLTAFSAGLLSLYFANPENTKADRIRPSDEGLSLSKDIFMLSLGVGLIAQGDEKKDKKNGVGKKAAKAAAATKVAKALKK